MAYQIDSLKQTQKALKQALEQTKSNLRAGQQVEKLLHLKILQTLVEGPLLDALALVQSTEELIHYQNQFPFPPHCVDLLPAAQTATPEVQRSWKEFLTALETKIEWGLVSNSKLNALKEHIVLLEQTKSFALWGTFFQHHEISDPIARLEAILAQATPVSQRLMKDALKHGKALEQLETQLERFADPKSLPQARLALKTLVEPLLSPAWADRIRTASPAAQLAAYETMEKAVELYDRAIKAMKASPQITGKPALFKEMLREFYVVMKALVDQYAKDKPDLVPRGSEMENYLRVIIAGIESAPNEERQLRPSAEFSVAAAMLGSKALFARHSPGTDEDRFTLIHKNCLMVLSGEKKELVTPASVATSLLPQPVKEAMARLEQERDLYFIGAEHTEEAIVIRYNHPLRNHSALLTLRYDVKTRSLTLEGQFLGQARTRWGEIAVWAEVLHRAGIAPLRQRPKEAPLELSVSWKAQEGSFSTCLDEFKRMGEYSLGFRGPTEVVAELCKSFPDKREKTVSLFLSIAKEKLSNADREECLAALRFVLALIHAGYGLEEAVNVAKQGINLPDVRAESLDLFRVLVEKGHGIEDALSAAKQGINLPDVEEESLDLFRVLVEKGHGIEDALSAAKQSTNLFGTSEESLNLFKALVEKGHGIEAAVHAAKQGISNVDWAVKLGSIWLFEMLVSKEEDNQSVIEEIVHAVAKEAPLDSDGFLDTRFYEFFETLSGNRHGLEAILNFIRQEISNHRMREISRKLWNIFMRTEKDIEAILNFAKRAAYDVNEQELSLQLFLALIEHGYAIHDIHNFAKLFKAYHGAADPRNGMAEKILDHLRERNL
jgi:hypothetical protein